MRRRVLHLRSSGGLLGAERVILHLCKYSPRFNWEPHVGVFLHPDKPTPELLTVLGQHAISAIRIPCRGRLDFQTIHAIREAATAHDIDLIHTHGYKENAYALASRTRLPKVATNHLWKLGTPSLCLYALLDACILHGFQKTVAVSTPIHRQLRRFGLPSRKLNIIRNGTDTESPAPDFPQPVVRSWRESLGLDPHAIVVGTLSSLSAEKGLDLLLEAATRLAATRTDIQFLLIGDGPARPRLEALAQRTGLSGKVIFAGRQDDIPKMLSLIDIFALPSRKEGLPMALLEAMATRKPPIATRVGDIPHVISASDYGLLIDSDSVTQLTAAIISLTEDEGLRVHLGRNASERIREHFSAVEMARQYCTLYDELLGRVPRTSSREH